MWQKRVTLALAVWLLTAVSSSAQTSLRYQFKKGEKLQYLLALKLFTKLSSKSIKNESTASQTIDTSWTVKDVDKDGKATITVKFERLRFTLGDLRDKVVFDSKDGKEPEGKLAKFLTPMLKAQAALEFDMAVDPRGKVSDVKLSEKSLEAAKGLADTPGAEALSTEELEKTMNQAIPLLPAEAVKPGATWNRVLTSKTPFGGMKIEQTLAYKGLNNRDGKMLAEITIKPNITVAADAKVKLKEQEGKGTAFFDPESGRMVELTATQTMSLEISVGGQEVTQDIRQSVSLKLQ
jgi:hypothetical protein